MEMRKLKRTKVEKKEIERVEVLRIRKTHIVPIYIQKPLYMVYNCNSNIYFFIF